MTGEHRLNAIGGTAGRHPVLFAPLRPRRPLRPVPSALAVAAALSYAGAALGNPTGGQVVSGGAVISTPNTTSLVIDQSTAKAIINWNSFSIGAGESVRFNQPSASSIALNRVLGNTRSNIFGQLSANGQIFLVNPNGVYMAPGAEVSAFGFLASSLGISDGDFLGGRYSFSRGTTAGAVINEGTINTSGGYTALLAPNIQNSGVIAARLGSVALAAGDRVTLDLAGDGLIRVAVDAAALSAAIRNSGSISADGGQVLLTARSANALLDTVLNNDGVIRADTLVEHNGTIALESNAGITVNSGSLLARGQNAGEKGGTISVTSPNVLIAANAVADASGAAGGGALYIGGSYQGRGPLANATHTVVQAGAQLKADATASGNGGEVVVWADNATGFAGHISATGGPAGGDGGQVEVSGRQHLAFQGTVATTAPLGHAGNLLLDPSDIVISDDVVQGFDLTVLSGGTAVSDSAASILNAALLNGLLGTTPVTIRADQGTNTLGGGTITVNAPIVSNAASAQLGLFALGDVTLNADVNLSGSNSRLDVTISQAGNLTAATGAITAGTFGFNVAGNVALGGTQQKIASLDTSLATGTINIKNGVPLAISGTLSTTTVAEDAITLVNAGPITLANSIDAGSKTLSLTTTGAGPLGDITQMTGQLVAGTLHVNTAGSDVLLLAGGNAIGGFGDSDLGGGSLSLVSNSVPLTVSGNVVAKGGILLLNDLALTINGTLDAGSSGLTLRAGGTSPITQGPAGKLTAGFLNLQTDQGNATLDSPLNAVSELSATSNSGALSFTNQGALQVDNITAPGGVTLVNAGPIVIADTGTLKGINAGANTLSLTTTGGDLATITQDFAAALTADTLKLNTDGAAVTLDSELNAINNLSASTLGKGALTLSNGGALTISNSVTAQGGISLFSGGSLSVLAPLDAGSGTMSLTAAFGSGISQSAAGAITAGRLEADTTVESAGADILLDTAVNHVVSLGDITAGGARFGFKGDVPLTVAGGLAADTGIAIESSATVALTGSLFTKNTLSLTTTAPGATITEFAGMVLDAQTLQLNTQDSSVFLNTGTNRFFTLGAGNLGAGELRLTSNSDEVVVDGGLTATGGVSLTANGAIKLPGGIDAGTSAISLTSTAPAGFLFQEATSQLIAGTLNISTMGGIASFATPANQVASLGTVSLGAGTLTLNNAVPLTVSGVVNAGNINLATTGASPITQSPTGALLAGSGQLTVNTAGSDAILLSTGPVANDAASVSANTGTGQFSYSGSNANTKLLASSVGGLDVTNSGDVTVFGSSTAARNIAIRSTGGTVNDLSGNILTASGGGITLRAKNDLSIEGTLTASDAGNGNVTLISETGVVAASDFTVGNTLTVQAGPGQAQSLKALSKFDGTFFKLSVPNVALVADAVDATGFSGFVVPGAVSVAPVTNGTPVDLGDVGGTPQAGALSINQAALDFMAGAQTIRIGQTGANALPANASTAGKIVVGLTNIATGDLELFSGAAAGPNLAIAQTGALTMGSGALGVTTAGGSVVLNTVTNSVKTLGTVSTGGGFFTLDSGGGGLTVNGPVSGSGITLFTTGGDMTLKGQIIDSGPTWLQNATGSILQPSLANANDVTAVGLKLIAPNGGISLTNAANAISGDVTLSALGDVGLTSSSGFNATVSTSGAATLSAGGDLTVGATVSGGLTTTTTNGGKTTLGGTTGVTVGGALNVTSAGAVTQGTPLMVTGTSTFSAPGQDITLTDTGNDFAGEVTVSGQNIQIVSSNKHTLHIGGDGTGELDVTGDLDLMGGTFGKAKIISAGNINIGVTKALIILGNFTAKAATGITQVNGLTVGGIASFDNSGGGADIALNNAGNNFGTAVNAQSSGAIGLTSANDLNVGVTGVSGNNVTMTSVVGDINLTGPVSASGGTITLKALSGSILAPVSTGTLTANSAELIAGGKVDLDQPGNAIGSGGTAGTIAGIAGSGYFAFQNNGALQIGSVGASSGITAAGGTVTLRASGGDLTQTPAGTISAKNLAFEILNGNATLDAINQITGNIAGLTTGAGNGITYHNKGGITLGAVSQLLVDGETIADSGLTTSAGGTVSLTSDSGSISQTGGTTAPITTGTLKLATTNNFVLLNDPANTVSQLGTVNLGTGSLNFTDTVPLTVSGTVSAGGIGLTDNGGGITLANNLNAGAGAVSLTTTGSAVNSVTQSGGTISADSVLVSTQGADATLNQANAITNLAASNLNGGSLSLTSAGALNVSSPVNAGNINLTAGNGALTVSSTLTSPGSLSLSSSGINNSISQSAAISGGSLTATTAGGSITLTDPGNDFSGTVNLTSAGNVSLTDKSGLTLGTSTTGGLTVTAGGALDLGQGTITGNLTAASNGGAISQSAGTGLGVTGSSSINADAASIALTQGNDFKGAVTLTNSGANNVALTSVTALTLGTSTVGSGTLMLTTTGALTQTGSLTQAAGAGATTLNAGAGGITLANPGNDFTGTVTATSGGNVSLTDKSGLTAVLNSGGSNTVSAGGPLSVSGSLGNLTASTTADKAGISASSSASTFTVNGLSSSNGAASLTAGNLVLAGPISLGSGVLTSSGASQTLQSGAVTAGGYTLAAGTMTFSGGSMTLSGPLTVSAGSTLIGGGTVANSPTANISGGFNLGGSTSLNLASTNVLAGGVVSGVGTLNGDLNNGGTVSPGNSPGTINIAGNYTQTGALNIEVGGTTPGTGFDRINVGGSSTLGGTLNVIQFGGFVPAAGSVYPIISSGSSSGSFGTVTTPPAFSGMGVQYQTQFTNLVMPAVVVPAVPVVAALVAAALDAAADAAASGASTGKAAVNTPFYTGSAGALMCLVGDVELLFYPQGAPVLPPLADAGSGRAGWMLAAAYDYAASPVSCGYHRQ